MDAAYRLLRYIAVFECQFICLFTTRDEHRLQIIKVQHQQAVLVGNMERYGEDTFLNLVQVHQSRQHQRPHFGHRGTNGMALFTKQIPKLRGIIFIDPALLSDFGCARRKNFVNLALGRSCHRHARQIAFNISDERRHADCGKTLDQPLQGNRFTSARGTRNQTVAVSAF